MQIQDLEHSVNHIKVYSRTGEVRMAMYLYGILIVVAFSGSSLQHDTIRHVNCHLIVSRQERCVTNVVNSDTPSLS